jgi:hypothetical protein
MNKNQVKIKVDTDLDGALLFMLVESPANIEVTIINSQGETMAELTSENHGGPACPKCGKYSENDAICPSCVSPNAMDFPPITDVQTFRSQRNAQMGEAVREALKEKGKL